MSSTISASCSQYLHQVVQNSNRTTLPLMDSLLNGSPVVVLARKRGAGWPVSSPAKAGTTSSARSEARTYLVRHRLMGGILARVLKTSAERCKMPALNRGGGF